ncbi:MAG: FkbM family methyltransferase [Terriglobia bacterium]
MQKYRALQRNCETRAGTGKVEFRVRPLNGNRAYCRQDTTDLKVLADVFFGEYHLPPPDLPEPRRILDLGSNIGLTMAHFACLYPRAQILGIELDRGNLEICRLNISPYADRCEVIWGAAWSHGGQVSYGGKTEWGFRVGETSQANQSVDAYTLDRLIDRLGTPVDFVKMDIEGAESSVLAHPDSWIQAVRCLKIEIHQPYTVAACVHDLQQAGLSCEIDSRHSACVIARNRRLLASNSPSDTSRVGATDPASRTPAGVTTRQPSNVRKPRLISAIQIKRV